MTECRFLYVCNNNNYIEWRWRRKTAQELAEIQQKTSILYGRWTNQNKTQPNQVKNKRERDRVREKTTESE